LILLVKAVVTDQDTNIERKGRKDEREDRKVENMKETEGRKDEREDRRSRHHTHELRRNNGRGRGIGEGINISTLY
jgi:hypothetical protein